MTVEYSFGMEEFPEEKPRKPRLLTAPTESLAYWDSFKDPRKASIGDIEVMTVKD
jgi:2,3-dihydroxy-p-cumate/2,3-dihydroxybenzoate 3,4-dioxygenase